MNSRRQWDIFCKVIDNFGDIGVSWRLSADLAARGQTVRLWVDDASALRWMAPLGAPGVTVLPWGQAADAGALAALLQANPGEVLVEAFGCDIPPQFLSAWLAAPLPGQTSPIAGRCWLNLEYLSAEAYVARSHALPSPVQHGPAAGCSKWFFYPGFTPQTGGLLREPDLIERMKAFEANEAGRWLQSLGLKALNRTALRRCGCPCFAMSQRRWPRCCGSGRPGAWPAGLWSFWSRPVAAQRR